jgi:hypothetical protein
MSLHPSFDLRAVEPVLSNGASGVRVRVCQGRSADSRRVVLTVEEARRLTDAIRSTGEVLYTLLERAHAGRAWAALGYPRFEDYVRTEFNMSRSRAYQILDQAKVVRALEAAVPHTATVPAITEAAARDLKGVLDQVIREIEEQLAEAEAEDTERIVAEILADQRSRTTQPTSNGWSTQHDHRGQRHRRATSDLMSSLRALQSMPDPETLVQHMPEARRQQVAESLAAAIEWLTEFQRRWSTWPDLG